MIDLELIWVGVRRVARVMMLGEDRMGPGRGLGGWDWGDRGVAGRLWWGGGARG